MTGSSYRAVIAYKKDSYPSFSLSRVTSGHRMRDRSLGRVVRGD